MRELVGYGVAANAAPIPNCSGITVFNLKVQHFTLEALRLHGPKIIRFKLVLGGKRWHAVG